MYKFIDKTAYAKSVKCFPTCFCFLDLYIGVKELTPKSVLKQSHSDLRRSGTGTLLLLYYKTKSLVYFIVIEFKFCRGNDILA